MCPLESHGGPVGLDVIIRISTSVVSLQLGHLEAREVCVQDVSGQRRLILRVRRIRGPPGEPSPVPSRLPRSRRPRAVATWPTNFTADSPPRSRGPLWV